jgi:tetratricopeptide (TPR) repeat protein
MTIDLYALCPCGSGKKIKFCCRDIAAEIDKVERLLEAGQRQAALEFIELAEKKYPGRAYLLARKAELQRELGLQTEADGTLRALLDREHDNPVALAESALLALSTEGEGVTVAIERLQRAVEVSTRDPWPDKVKEAIAAVADACTAVGYLPASLAHTVLFLETEPESEGAASALYQLCASAQVPLLFKELRSFRRSPEDAPWRSEFNAAMSQADRGFWLRAERQLTALTERAGDAPAVWHNVAVLRSWLGQEESSAVAWRRYAALDVPLDDAVEAEAIALELDPTPASESIDVVRVTYPIRDMDRVIASATTNKRCLAYPLELGGADGETDQPPPRSTHFLLDAALPTAAEFEVNDVPLIAGYLFVFGKETDREARLVVQLQRNERFETCRSLVGEVFGDALGPPQGEEVLGQREFIPFWSAEEFWFPNGTPLDRVRELRAQLRDRHVFDVWPRRPWKYLDGRSPEQAAHDCAGQVKLLGVLLYVELISERNTATDFDFNLVRRHLGLPEATPLPADTDPSEVPLARLARLPVEQLSDDRLLTLLSRAVHYRASAAAQRAALEVVARPSLDEKTSKPAVYTTLALLAEDSRTALRYVDQGRHLAEAAGESSAQFDLHEVTLRLRRGEADEAGTLINHLMQEHIDEPGVAQALRGLFTQMGLVGPDGRPRVGPGDLAEATETEPAEPATKLWTPGSDQPAAAAKPSLIIPG